jgi:hypothetical protein
MPGLVPGIHAVPYADVNRVSGSAWMAGTSPAMTDDKMRGA